MVKIGQERNPSFYNFQLFLLSFHWGFGNLRLSSIWQQIKRWKTILNPLLRNKKGWKRRKSMSK
ncbi:unnamed protein product, partial [Vitis vinifera]